MKNKFRIHKSSLRVSIGFFVLSVFYILFSDQLLLKITIDAAKITLLQTYKGWFYITIASLILFYLINYELSRKQKLSDLLNNKNNWQNKLISNLPGIEVMIFDKSPGFLFSHGPDFIGLFSDKPGETRESFIIFRKNGVKVSFDKLKDAVLKGESFDMEDSKDEKFFEIRCRPLFDMDNSVFAGFIVIQDVTERKRMVVELNEEKNNYEALFTEYHSVNLELKNSYEKLMRNHKALADANQRYEDFLTHTADAIYRIDIDEPVDLSLDKNQQMKQIMHTCFLAECNAVFGKIYGFEDYKKLIGYRFRDVKVDNNIKNFKQILEAAINNNYRLNNHLTEEFDVSGNPAFFSNKAFGIIENNRLMHIWGIKTDITQQKEYEQKLVEAKKQAEDSDKLKSAFLANMSHEIRTPLNGIVGFSELLAQENLTDEQRNKYSRIVRTSNQQLLRIIEDILDISRIETGQLKIESAPFSLNLLIKDCATYLNQELEKKSKKLNTEIYKELPDIEDIIMSDKLRIYQVLTNFLNNSIKFTETGFINLGYKLTTEGKIEFFVSDSGIGIPKEYHKSIFVQFKQVESYTSRKYGGTGLGLSISKGIAELLGGEIVLESELGKGSTFRMIIPRIKNEV